MYEEVFVKLESTLFSVVVAVVAPAAAAAAATAAVSL